MRSSALSSTQPHSWPGKGARQQRESMRLACIVPLRQLNSNTSVDRLHRAATRTEMSSATTPSPDTGILRSSLLRVAQSASTATKQLLGDFPSLAAGANFDRLRELLKEGRIRGVGVSDVKLDGEGVREHHIACAYDLLVALEVHPHLSGSFPGKVLTGCHRALTTTWRM